MSSPEPHEVRLSRAAAREFQRLPDRDRATIRRALKRLAVAVSTTGERGGKSSKSIRGVSDSFHRLRVGDLRVMYDVLAEERVILVLGIVNRRDLERWLRSR